MLGEYLQSPYFKRDKFELFALQHVQIMVRHADVATCSDGLLHAAPPGPAESALTRRAKAASRS